MKLYSNQIREMHSLVCLKYFRGYVIPWVENLPAEECYVFNEACGIVLRLESNNFVMITWLYYNDDATYKMF
jgi:hypothetical protein